MSAATTQRLVPIRPSPHKSITKTIAASSSPLTLTPPKTAVKRKLPSDSAENVKAKRRINFNGGLPGGYVVTPSQPTAVSRRNARERNRVKQVNNGFATLRQHIPGAAKAKKISKVETLKQAVDYIRALKQLLDEHDSIMTQRSVATSSPSSVQVLSLSAASTGSNFRPLGFLGGSYYYSENVSPASTSSYPLTASVVSPSCSEGSSAASPSSSYASESSQGHQGSSSTPQDPFPTVSFDPYPEGGTFDPYDTVPSPDEDYILEDAIAMWEMCQ